jgi:hypothetical protein
MQPVSHTRCMGGCNVWPQTNHIRTSVKTCIHILHILPCPGHDYHHNTKGWIYRIKNGMYILSWKRPRHPVWNRRGNRLQKVSCVWSVETKQLRSQYRKICPGGRPQECSLCRVSQRRGAGWEESGSIQIRTVWMCHVPWRMKEVLKLIQGFPWINQRNPFVYEPSVIKAPKKRDSIQRNPIFVIHTKAK